MENEKLLQQIRSGHNKEALQEMYKPFSMISSFIRQHGGSVDDARDVFQESLLIFYRNAQKPEFKLTASLSTYLFSICKYKWKDELKKKNRHVSFEVKESADEIQDYQLAEQKFKWMDHIIQSLGEKCREILQLFYYQKFSMEQIAQKLDYKNVDTVKTQKYKCIERAKAMASEPNVKSIMEEL